MAGRRFIHVDYKYRASKRDNLKNIAAVNPTVGQKGGKCCTDVDTQDNHHKMTLILSRGSHIFKSAAMLQNHFMKKCSAILWFIKCFFTSQSECWP